MNMTLPVKQSYVNVFILYMSIFAAGAVLLEIAPTFIFIMDEFEVNAMMVGFLVAAFVMGFALFGALIMFKGATLAGVNLRWSLMVGTGMVGIFGFLVAFAPNYWSMWIFRFAVGFGCIMLIVSGMLLALSWFPLEQLNTVVVSGTVSMVLGTLVAAFFGSKIMSVAGGWKAMYLIFGGMGLLAFILWLILGRGAPSATNGAGLVSSEKSPAVRVLTNKYVWCSAGMLYMLLCYLSIFAFLLVALPGSFEVAKMTKGMIFPLSFYVSAIFNIPVMISGSMIGLWLLTKTGRRRPFSVIPSFLASVVGLVIFSLPFSGVWMGVIIELIVLAVFLLMLVIPTWLVQLQELPGVDFGILVNTVGAVLLISGIAGVIVPIVIGWALDKAIMMGTYYPVFRNALYFFVLTWLICGLAGLLIPEPEASK
jgi:ACS family glucarate transporter-like MFS transporter